MERFAKNYYNLFKEAPLNVLEIGSRDGNDADYLKRYFNIPNNKVFLVEPNPPSIERMKLKYPDYKIFDVAISNKVGVVKFNSIQNSNQMFVGMSSLLERRKDTGYSEEERMRQWENWIDVQAITGKMLLDEIGEKIYDLVKIDVEGYTYQVLESFGEELKKFRYLHLEAEQKPLWKDQVTYNGIFEYMKKMGFNELYKIDFSIFGQCDTVWYNVGMSK